MHLTDAAYDRLLDRSLPPPEAQALATHLAEPCQDCEAYLAGRAAVDPLDGVVDLALARLARGGRRAAQGSDGEFARLGWWMRPNRFAPP